MTVEVRAEGLAAAARTHRSELLALAQPIADRSDTSIQQPGKAATVMAAIRTPIGEHCLAEVIVTSAEVTVGHEPGWACVMGWDPEAALAAALLDAGAPTVADDLARQALRAERAMQRERRRDVEATWVGVDQ